MPISLTIPTIFTARDEVSKHVKDIARGYYSLGAISEASISKQQMMFNRLNPFITEAKRRILEFISAAALIGGTIALFNHSAQAVVKYEDNLASFRTIVSDLSDSQFKHFESAAMDVSKSMRVSAADTLSAFESIAGLNAEFAKSPEAISAVTKSTLVLAKAAKMELGDAATNLVGIMNQFGFGADQANRTINVLAAGQAVGAASISQTSEAFKNFGSVAKGSNITLEQSVGLIQTLGKFSIFGAEAGTKLRGSVLKLQQAGVGYKSGQFQIMDALEETRKKFERLKTSKQQDLYLTKMFGAENISVGRTLVSNISLINECTKGVTGTSEAHKAAAIQSQTLSNVWKELVATWDNMVLSSNQAGSALSLVKDVLRFVTNNMEAIIKVTGIIIGLYTSWWILIKAQKIALVAYNIVLGITNGLQGASAFTVMGNVIAYKAYRVAVVAAAGAQKALNVIMSMNPIGLIIIGIAALIAYIAIVIKYWDKWGAAVAVFSGPMGIVISLLKAFYDNWGMIVKAFKTDGILAGFKAIGKVILEAVLYPFQQLFEILSALPGKAGIAFQKMANKIANFRQDMGFNALPSYLRTNEQKATGYEQEDTPYPQRVFYIPQNPNNPQNKAAVDRIGAISGTQKIQLEIVGSENVKVKENKSNIPIQLTNTLGNF